jgi:hypothetical protein
MALGSNQPLTEMCTRNFHEVKGRPAHKAHNLTDIVRAPSVFTPQLGGRLLHLPLLRSLCSQCSPDGWGVEA